MQDIGALARGADCPVLLGHRGGGDGGTGFLGPEPWDAA